jgi:DNA polymerase-3 subunit epsilon
LSPSTSETANRRLDSACALGLVRVERGEIIRRESWLLRPPSDRFRFTRVHGLTWERVNGALPFGEVWPALDALLAGVDHYCPAPKRKRCSWAGPRW